MGRMSNETASIYSDEQLEETQAAIAAVHNTTCRGRKPDDGWKACQGCRRLYNGATVDAITHLKDNPRDAARARLILHSSACMSGCTGAEAAEHARRQSQTVAAIRKYLAGSG
jgi:hypothetical protein